MMVGAEASVAFCEVYQKPSALHTQQSFGHPSNPPKEPDMETAPNPSFSPFDLLPLPLVALILRYLGTEEKLLVAPLVCQAWRKLCRSEPLVWQIIDLSDWEDGLHHVHMDEALTRLSRLAGKELRKLDLQFIDCEELANAVTRCQGSLEWLRLGNCDLMDEWAREYAPMLSKLKHLELLTCAQITPAGVAVFGQNCPLLTHLSLDPYERNLFYVNNDNEVIEQKEPSAVETQSKELLFILTILTEFPKLESLKFLGKWTDFDVKQLSDSTVRERLLKDVQKKYKYMSNGGDRSKNVPFLMARSTPLSGKLVHRLYEE